MDIKSLVKITSRAWSLNILALMHAGTPGRQAALLQATGAGRTAFAHSLYHLVDLELLERNPGHGHPLRPEYRLTQKGIKAAIVAHKVKTAVPQFFRCALLRRAWTIPILAVAQEPRHFIDIKKVLLTITDRALSHSLKELQAHFWLNRKIDQEIRPPRPLYQASNIGEQICRAVSLQV